MLVELQPAARDQQNNLTEKVGAKRPPLLNRGGVPLTEFKPSPWRGPPGEVFVSEQDRNHFFCCVGEARW